MAQEFVHQLIISGPELSETKVLPEGSTTVGRQEGNALRLNHPMVSRKHAQFDCTATVCQITDLGSANGTSVNSEAIEPKSPTPLASGATITIGPFTLTYEAVAVEPKEPPPPKPAEKPKPPEKPPKPPPKKEEPVQEEPPPPPSEPPAPPPPPDGSGVPEIDYSQPPVGLTYRSARLLEYLPGIYHTDFMARFLAIFESILTPVEWNVDNFDLYLNPKTTPPGFLPWLANWFSITFDSTWTVEQQRELLAEAHKIYARRGTRWALSRVLEIYTRNEPEIIDLEDEDPFTFTVKLPLTQDEVDRTLIEQIVDANKPAHTSYKLLFKRRRQAKKS